MPFARCHIGRIHYAERGERRPGAVPAVLVHGAGASSAVWMSVLGRLARTTRVVAPDLPGHGPSAPLLEGAITVARFREAVGELGAALGLGRAVLVGHSMGALVAIDAALTWPDRVVALVLCGAGGGRLPVDPGLLRVLRDDYPRFPEWLAERAFSPAARPALRRAFVAAGVAAPRDVTLADFEACIDLDLTPRLPEIRCPMVWLDGADDTITPASPGRPGEVLRLESVGHMVPIEAPRAVAEVVRRIAAGASPHLVPPPPIK